ncbi:MAG: S8 family serine peptidase [Bdellovibrionota bacterium]
MSFRLKLELSAILLLCGVLAGCGGESAPPPYPAPANFTVTPGDAQNTLDWDLIEDVTAYRIHRSTNAVFTPSSGNVIGQVAAPPYTDNNLVNGVRYYYAVTAQGPEGTGAATANVLGRPNGPPDPPDGLCFVIGSTETTITWNAAPGADLYNLYFATTSGVTAATGTKVAAVDTPFNHTGLTDGTPYYYVLTSENGVGGEGPESEEISLTPDAAYDGTDPLLRFQWHLQNTGQDCGEAGEDLDVFPAWDDGYDGTGVRIAIVDDGLEIAHEDLSANVVPGASYDYDTGDTDPTGGAHGTSVAGVAAARDSNGFGGNGVAPRAGLVGFNVLQDLTTANEADAMGRGSPNVFVSNNSWGPSDGAGSLDASTALWQTAILNELGNGRGEKGTLFTWAGGNGAPTDNSNYDGYANFRGVIAVCAVTFNGVRSSYSEPGANLWVCAPSSGQGRGITTTDRSGSEGYNSNGSDNYADTDYTNDFGGTSSATPAVTGTIALILDANPNLGWRDVREILALTARKNDPTDPDWTTNDAGYDINHQYGFGVADVAAAVTAALSWTVIAAPQVTYISTAETPNLAIPDNNGTGVSDTTSVSSSGITDIEWVEVVFTAANHAYSGDLEITLTAPGGTESVLAETHGCAGDNCSNYDGWVFGVARHLGESADGTWTLKVVDGAAGDTGTFQSWQLKIYGR